jgi:hypothetical protein
MKNSNKAGFAISLLSLCASFAHNALAVEAPITADTYVSAAVPGNNFGAINTLNVGGGSSTFLSFDLSTLPAGATGAKVAKASMLLWVNKIGAPGTLDVLPVTAAWNEASLTYNTSPGTGAAVASAPLTAAGQYIVVDVTALVRNWVDYPGQNFGLAVAASAAQPLTVGAFDSKENTATSHAPLLDITFDGDGTPGPAGEAGPAGPAGPVGPVGAQGIAGVKGDKGDAGLQGAAGVKGDKGDKGDAGLQGLAGAKGDKGDAGAAGAQGVAGPQGVAGAKGDKGDTGAAGATGAAGPQGIAGTKGDKGDTGAAGATGATGLTGPAGPAGATGATGLTGPAGPTGSTGATGAAGTTGAAGPAGATGPQGPAGAKGATGATGATGPAGPAFAGVLVDVKAVASGQVSVVQCPMTAQVLVFGSCAVSGGVAKYALQDFGVIRHTSDGDIFSCAYTTNPAAEGRTTIAYATCIARSVLHP